jgi:predicted RNase H-like HicB family nuclease
MYERRYYRRAHAELPMRFIVALEPAEESGYTVHAPALPGCTSEGETREEALKNIKEHIELYLEPENENIDVTEGVEFAEVNV